MHSWEKSLIIDEFHKLYYEGIEDERLFEQTTWLGVTCLKCPLDMWIYQEILYQLKPDLIIETGTYHGGSALYFGHLCDTLGHGKVVTIDVMEKERPTHPRVTYLTGSSTDPEIARSARALAPEDATVMVILDSDHSKSHVLEELRLYSPMVTPGQYLIVEDTNINGHPVRISFGEGPYEAVSDFLQESQAFVPDASRERLLLTFNPRGFLKRLAPGEAPPVVAASDDPEEQVPRIVQIMEKAHSEELARWAREFQQLNRELRGVEDRVDAAWQKAQEAQERASDAWKGTHAAQAKELEAWNQAATTQSQLGESRRETGEARQQASQLSTELSQLQAKLQEIESHRLVRLSLKVLHLLGIRR